MAHSLKIIENIDIAVAVAVFHEPGHHLTQCPVEPLHHPSLYVLAFSTIPFHLSMAATFL